MEEMSTRLHAGLALVPRVFFNESWVAPPAWSCSSWLSSPSRALLTCARLYRENHIQTPSNMGVQRPGSWSLLGNFWKIQTCRGLCVLGWTCFKSIFDTNCVNTLSLHKQQPTEPALLSRGKTLILSIVFLLNPGRRGSPKGYEIRRDLELEKLLLHWDRVSPGTEWKPHLSLERWDGEIVDGLH